MPPPYKYTLLTKELSWLSVVTLAILALERLRQEDYKFKVSLGYEAR